MPEESLFSLSRVTDHTVTTLGHVNLKDWDTLRESYRRRPSTLFWFTPLWCLLYWGISQTSLTARAKLRLLSSQEIISWATRKEGIKEEIVFNLDFVYGEIFYLLLPCYFIIFLLENSDTHFSESQKGKDKWLDAILFNHQGIKEGDQ